MNTRRSRVLLAAGLVLMILGALDPLEGSVVILAGAALAAAGAFLTPGRRCRFQVAALALVGAGVAALFGLSAIGGVGGNSGSSIWWLLLCLPYPAGWILGLVGAALKLREPREASA